MTKAGRRDASDSRPMRGPSNFSSTDWSYGTRVRSSQPSSPRFVPLVAPVRSDRVGFE